MDVYSWRDDGVSCCHLRKAEGSHLDEVGVPVASSRVGCGCLGDGNARTRRRSPSHWRYVGAHPPTVSQLVVHQIDLTLGAARGPTGISCKPGPEGVDGHRAVDGATGLGEHLERIVDGLDDVVGPYSQRGVGIIPWGVSRWCTTTIVDAYSSKVLACCDGGQGAALLKVPGRLMERLRSHRRHTTAAG